MWKSTVFCILSTLVISTMAHGHHEHNKTPKFSLPSHTKVSPAVAASAEQQMLIDAIKSTVLVLKEQFSNTNHSEVVKNVSSLGFSTFVQNTQINSIDGLVGNMFSKWADTVIKRLNADNATKAEV